MQDLLDDQLWQKAPLADKMRPRTLDTFFGQQHLIGPGRLLRRAIEADRVQSCIFWGPPGCGKTTLAHIIARRTSSAFVPLNAVTTGVAQMREVVEEARRQLQLYAKSTYILLDECHRWNKAQSDSILPYVEQGIVRFIGSTTENPMIAMTPALVSRCRVFAFEPLTADDVIRALQTAIADEERGLGRMQVQADASALSHFAHVANGDVRSALSALELAALTTPASEDGMVHVTLAVAEESIQKPVLALDESLYYDMLSAFCKSLRGSDSDAALAWMARLIYGGVDARIIARRVVVHASEDVGLANPTAMLTAAAAMQAVETIGLPEARIPLAQAVIAICESPKSNAVIMAIDGAMTDAQASGRDAVPVHLRDAHYKGAAKLGHGKGYLYPHDYPGHFIKQNYMPKGFEDKRYYKPSNMGSEQKIRQLRAMRGKEDDDD